MNQKVEKAKDMLIALLAVGMGVCIALTVWAVFLRQPQAAALVPDVPESAPEQLEPNQTPMQGEDGTGTDSTEESTDAEDSGVLVNLSYDSEVTISIRSGKARLYFGSGGISEADAVVQLVVQDQVLAQSGRLTPDNEVQTLDLVEGAVSRLVKGSYEGKIQVFYYDLATGEKTMLSTVIPVTVKVVS